MDKETKTGIWVVLLILLTPIVIGLGVFMFELSSGGGKIFTEIVLGPLLVIKEIDNPKSGNAGNADYYETINNESTYVVSTYPEPTIEFIYHTTERGNLDVLRAAEVGSFIYFGEYEQDNDEATGKEAIEWLVLDKQDDKMLVISRYGLDRQPFHTEYEEITWEACSLRGWLNSSFYETAFIPEEKSLILTSEVSADAKPLHGTDGGNNTMDQVFLLSIDEADRFFEDDVARTCVGTPYCNALWTNEGGIHVTCCWWLRSPGLYSYDAALVKRDGYVLDLGDLVGNIFAVRPALWIKLSQ